tara:strand:+ start:5511 stop:6437 length:927 start_codon:yes stop_codon:yes gene_type:complete
MSALFFGLGSAIAQSGDESVPEIRFIAYNVENYLRQDRTVKGEIIKDVPKPDEEKRAVVATFAKLRPAIIGLCEMGTMEDVADLQERLGRVGLEYPHVEWVEGGDEVRHLVLLSQFPIVARQSVRDLTYQIGEREFALSRGILDATVQVNPDYQLRLVGCHLKSKRPVPDADQALMRRNEAHLLRQHVEAVFDEDPDVNLLVYGDFNDTRNEVPIKAVQGRFGSDRYLTALRLEDRFGMSWTHHWSFAEIYSKIDFVMVSRGLYREINQDRSFIYHYSTQDDSEAWAKASDHRPLVTAIRPVDLKTSF